MISIRRAKTKDIPKIGELLRQVLEVHRSGRPDIFRAGTAKYTEDELSEIICDDSRPVFVAVDGGDTVLGYAFCAFVCHAGSNILTDIKTLYIDDLCVDEGLRGKHIGRALYDFVLDFAKSRGCYNLTLNVWACNTSALRFYEKLGLTPQKIGMEKIL